MTSHAEAGKGHYISNKWHKGKGKPFQSYDPSTGSALWKGNGATSIEVNEAVISAKGAFEAWSSLSLEKREGYLKAFCEELKLAKYHLALAISKETGKPQWESATEVDAMAGKIAISIDAYEHRCPDKVKELAQSKSITRHKPHGVCAVLGPYNFPGHLPNGHIVPALLAGNTVVFKPSELTPGVAEATLEIWEKAKLPRGVINMVQGGHETGAALAESPNINALFFTGSYRTGRLLSEMYGKHPDKILALEMGGNNPLVFTKVSHPKAAAFATVQSAFLTSGQRCTCARRLIVLKGKEGDEFLEILKEITSHLQVGKYTDRPEPFMGPVISEKVALALLDKQELWKNSGGIPLLQMKLLRNGTGLVTPGIIDMTLVEEKSDDEIFGPLLQVIRVDDFNAAIEEANRTRYGLSAGILSDSKEEYEEFYRKVRAGIVNWNMQTTGASSAAPFGGIGYSGNHRPSAYYAADYCSFPVASMESASLELPATFPPGVKV